MAKIFEDELLNDVANVALGAAAGFAIFWFASHQKSPLHDKIPQKKVRNITILPHIKIVKEDTHIHFHHWFNITLVYALLYWKKDTFWEINY